MDSASSKVISYEAAEGQEEAAEGAEGQKEAQEEGQEKAQEEAQSEAALPSLVVTSDDGATTLTFSADGSFVFAFESYGVSDPGTWSYGGGKANPGKRK